MKDTFGDFLLELYHTHVINEENEWRISKNLLVQSMMKFLPNNSTHDLSKYDKYLHDRGDKFKVDIKQLLAYRSERMKYWDVQQRKVSINIGKKITTKSERNGSASMEDLEILNIKKNAIFKGLFKQSKNMVYKTSDCERRSKDLIYGKHQNAEQERIEKVDENSRFTKLQFAFSKKSFFMCFTLTANTNVVVEKICLDTDNCVEFINDEQMPHSLAMNTELKFMLDGSRLTPYCKNILLICHRSAQPNEQIVEQYEFMITNKDVGVQVAQEVNGVAVEILGKCVTLPEYPPNQNQKAIIKMALEDLLFKDYIKNHTKLTPANYTVVMQHLLKISYGTNSGIYRNTNVHHICENVYQTSSISAGNDDKIITIEENEQFKKLKITTMTVKQLLNQRKYLNIGYGHIQEVTDGGFIFDCSAQLSPKSTYTVIPEKNRIQIRLQFRALELLTTMPKWVFDHVLFPTCTPQKVNLKDTKYMLYNKLIDDNPKQLFAVKMIANGMTNKRPYILCGPTGTGKTDTIVEAILQICVHQPNARILAVCNSNHSCDQLTLKLLRYLKEHSIFRIYSKCKKFTYLQKEIMQISNVRTNGSHFYPSVRSLHKFQIIICTPYVLGILGLGGLGTNLKGVEDTTFTHVFIDDAAAISEADLLIIITTAMIQSTKLILTGDTALNEPVIRSKEAVKFGLGRSFMERLLNFTFEHNDTYNKYALTILSVNYRSHPHIVGMLKEIIYADEVTSHFDVDGFPLCKTWHITASSGSSMVFHNIKGPSQPNGTSKINKEEVDCVLSYVKDLIYFGINGQKVKEDHICIVTPYKAQVGEIEKCLRRRQWKQIAVGTSEKLSGIERPIVIVSFVQSRLDCNNVNKVRQALQFITNVNLINAMLSRAQSLLIMIGDIETLEKSIIYETIIEEVRQKGIIIDPKTT